MFRHHVYRLGRSILALSLGHASGLARVEAQAPSIASAPTSLVQAPRPPRLAMTPTPSAALTPSLSRAGARGIAPAALAPAWFEPRMLVTSRSGLAPLRASVARSPGLAQIRTQGRTREVDARAGEDDLLDMSSYSRARVALGATRAMEEGVTRYRQGRFREAWLSFDSVLAVLPDDARARLGQFLCHVHRGRYDSASQELALLPGAVLERLLQPEYLAAFGVSDPVEGSEILKKLQAWRPEGDASALALSAMVLWTEGNGVEARRQAGRISERFPDSPFAALAAAMERAPGAGSR